MLVLTGRQAPAMLFEGVPLGEPVTKVTSTTYIDYLELMSACRNWVPLQKNCWMPNPEQVPPGAATPVGSYLRMPSTCRPSYGEYYD